MSLVDLLRHNGCSIRKVSSTHGGEYAGACPWCGGKDRFRVWPEHDGGRYWCRVCGKAGDSVQYLREHRGLSFADACRFIGREPGPRKNGTRPAPSAWAPKEVKSPPDSWQEKARTFLDGAVSCLWMPQGESMRAWLHDIKGLSDTTIRAACLGLNLADIYEPRAVWGLEPALKEDGTEKKQWIPAGLVIPLVIGGAVHRLRIRRSDPDAEPRYVIVSGSSSAPMAWGQDKGAVVIVESELDGLLLHQEVGDLAAVVSMGSATSKPDAGTHELLTAVEVILVSLDTDGTGAKAAWAFWPATYGGKVKRWPCVKGKDPSEARLNGLDLRAWVVAGIFGTKERFERFCIQTVDGGLSDVEAIQRGEIKKGEL